MNIQAADPLYEVVNRQKGILAVDPEFIAKPFHDHPDCSSRQALLREGNYAWGRNDGHRCTNCEKLWQQA